MPNTTLHCTLTGSLAWGDNTGIMSINADQEGFELQGRIFWSWHETPMDGCFVQYGVDVEYYDNHFETGVYVNCSQAGDDCQSPELPILSNPYTLGTTLSGSGSYTGCIYDPDCPWTVSATVTCPGGGCGGDPHCLGLDGRHFELKGVHDGSYTLYHSSTLALNATLNQFKVPDHVLDKIPREHALYYSENFLTAFSQIFLKATHPHTFQPRFLHLHARHPDWSGFKRHKGQPPVPLAMIPGAEDGNQYHTLHTPNETLHAWSISLHGIPYLNFWIVPRANTLPASGLLGQTSLPKSQRLPPENFRLSHVARFNPTPSTPRSQLL